MNPASQAKRRKLAQYEENEIELEDEQNDEMCAIVKKMGDEDLQR